MEICGEEDRFRGEKIKIAPLQISTDLPNVEKAKLLGHGHQREDLAMLFRKEPRGNVFYDQLFQAVKSRVEEIPMKGSTPEAEKKFVLRHGNLVIISGQPGIGKSTLTKRLIEEMWTSSLYDPDIVFFIRFRDVDYDKNTDLLGFLAPTFTEVSNNNDRNAICKNIEKSDNVYIIMDGLDEASIDPNMNQPQLYSIDAISNAAGFIQNLIAGNILPQSKKMITSRPYRFAQLPRDFQPKVLFTIQGLDEAGLKQICSNICAGEEACYNKILGHLESHPDLRSYCHTPVLCIMVMESLKKMYLAAIKNSKDQTEHLGTAQAMDLYQEDNQGYAVDYSKKKEATDQSQSFSRVNVDKLTAIFVCVLNDWILEKLTRTAKFQIKEISDLAFEGFLSDQFYFREFDLKMAGIDFSNNTTFLNTILKGTKVMYFVHLLWQEFLVAVNMKLYMSKQTFKDNLSKLGSEKFEAVTRFLFGLCNKNTLSDLLDYVEIEKLNIKSDREESEKLLKQLAIEKLQSYRDAEIDETSLDSYYFDTFRILRWAWEMGDDDFTKKAASLLRNKIQIFHHLVLSRDILCFNRVLRARDIEMTLEITLPDFVGDCCQYFFRELHQTLKQNPKIQVGGTCFF